MILEHMVLGYMVLDHMVLEHMFLDHMVLEHIFLDHMVLEHIFLEHMVLGHTIETYGRRPHNRNICFHAWLILLFVPAPVVISLLWSHFHEMRFVGEKTYPIIVNRIGSKNGSKCLSTE